MAHILVPEAEEVLDVRIPVLDHGFVALIDYCGGDARIAEAARTSYQKGTKSKNDDTGLIDHLTRHAHTSPLEMVEFLFHIKLPIVVMRQLVRHRMASLNEQSARYSVLESEFYFPDLDDVQPQSKSNKQGREGELSDEIKRGFLSELALTCARAYDDYTYFLDSDVSRELARMILPVNVYTQCYWKIDWNNLSKFLWLRKDGHAQKEIRDFADVIGDLAKRVVPDAYASWEEHRFYAKTFSRTELMILKQLLGDFACDAADLAEELTERAQESGLSKTLTREFLSKLEV